MKEKKKNLIKIIIIVILMCISLGALSYSFGWIGTKKLVSSENLFILSDVNVGLKSEKSIFIDEVVPTIDRFGLENEAFSFSLTNNSSKSEKYVLKLVDKDLGSSIPNSAIRYQLTINGKNEEVYNLSSSGLIDVGELEKGEKKDYSLKVWLDYNSNISKGSWNKILFVEAGTGNIDTSGANKPVLNSGMIPVYYNEKEESWCKAEEANLSKEYSWYDYDGLMWANAVTVMDNVRDYYQKADAGTPIAIKDINSMWVWIPRYKYTLFDNKNLEMIDITFEHGIKSTGTLNCHMENNEEVCSTDEEEKTYTHPAFTLNGEELEGIWVSKFEAGVNDNDVCNISASVVSCNSEDKVIIIKPFVKSINYITMDNLSKSIKKMGIKNNIYGFNTNELDIHLMKNSEWGAVTYLYYSKYGKLNNNDYSSENRNIYRNGNDRLTGYSIGSSNNGNSYKYDAKFEGMGASTTGNIYGIFDMYGGKGEFVSHEDNYYKLGDGLKEFDKKNNLKTDVWYRGGDYTSKNKDIFSIESLEYNNSGQVGGRCTLKSISHTYMTKW